MNINKLYRIAIALMILVGVSFAQFGKIDVTFDDRLLRDSDRQHLQSLQDEIKWFFQNTSWDDDYSDLAIPLYIQIIFDGTSSKGSEQIYLAQALFSNGLDQRYFDKSVQFTYNDGSSLYFDEVVFEPLASFLAYYANLILAGEADTYEPKGGNRFYETARNIALRGSSSDYPPGWAERVRVENLLSGNHGLRKVRLATYFGIELFEYGKIEASAKQFIKMIAGLDEVHLQSPRDHYTKLFMDGHAEKLTEVLSILQLKSVLDDLVELNPDNQEIYERGLPKSSK